MNLTCHSQVALLCLGAFLLAGCTQQQPDHHPNIIFIMADDLGYGDPGSYNRDSKTPTPHMDRLAVEGIRFTDAHSPSAVCTPTRYGVLTGRYSWRTSLERGVLWGYSPNLIDTSRVTVASMLQEAGYYTAGFGKWHLGLGAAEETDYFAPLIPGPPDHGFDYYHGIPASLDMQPYVYFENHTVEEAPTDSVAFSAHRRQEGGGFWRAGPMAPSFVHEEVLPITIQKTVAFIEQRAETPHEPFFAYVPLSAPHTPWLPTAEYNGKTDIGYYGDFVVQVDDGLGDILTALDETGLAENTLIIFTSDNGSHWPVADIEKWGHQANGPWRGQKADIWEGGHRVPYLARWPGHIPAGVVSNEPMIHTDLMATLAALVGINLPDDAGEDSYNLLPAYLGRQDGPPIREAMVHHSLNGMFAIRQGDWKLIEGLGSGGFTQPAIIEPADGGPAGQLYNLAEDPEEATNVYADHPEIVAALSALLEQYRTQGFSR